MSTRQYVTGLPVVVTINDNGFVIVSTDLDELEVALRKDAWPDEGITDEQRDADAETVGRWTATHSLSNEGYVDSEEES